MRRRDSVSAALAVAVLVLAGLPGCSDRPSTPIVSAAPTRTPRAPAFDSRDEALEAAVATYQRYVDLWNQIAAEGGVESARLFEVMETDEAAAGDMAIFANLASNNVRVAGSVAFSKPRLMQYQDSASLIQMYACFDLSGARLINQEGLDVTPDRREQVPLMITFAIAEADTVLISKSDEWNDSGLC